MPRNQSRRSGTVRMGMMPRCCWGWRMCSGATPAPAPAGASRWVQGFSSMQRQGLGLREGLEGLRPRGFEAPDHITPLNPGHAGMGGGGGSMRRLCDVALHPGRTLRCKTLYSTPCAFEPCAKPWTHFYSPKPWSHQYAPKPWSHPAPLRSAVWSLWRAV